MMPHLTFLGLCGSLRVGSSNRALLEVAADLVPEGGRLVLHDGLGDLPLFRPDATEPAPEAVLRFRAAVAEADGVIIASPEYAHGITGVLKNGLDWVVASGEFSGKPVAVPNTSLASHHAHGSLVEILLTMDARVVASASGRIPLPSLRITRREIAGDPEMAPLLREMMTELVAAVRVD